MLDYNKGPTSVKIFVIHVISELQLTENPINQQYLESDINSCYIAVERQLSDCFLKSISIEVLVESDQCFHV